LIERLTIPHKKIKNRLEYFPVCDDTVIKVELTGKQKGNRTTQQER